MTASIDYLAVGHVTEDVWKDGSKTPGGTVMYSARAARAFVDAVHVLTAAADDFAAERVYPKITVHRIASPNTTQFWNIYENGKRIQFTKPSPITLGVQHFTLAMRRSKIVHLAPVCNEVDVDVLSKIHDDVFVGITPQGWLRRWGEDGRVVASEWKHAAKFLRRANAVVMSIDDIDGDWQLARKWAAQTKLLVVTQGELGCTAIIDGAEHRISAPKVVEVEPTGAGDIFAATLYIMLQSGYAPIRACEVANCIAAQSVTRKQAEGLPSKEDIDRCAGR